MNDGILFLFILWFWWIVFTFLINKAYKQRFSFSFLFLVLICLQGNFTGIFAHIVTCAVLLIFTSYLLLDQRFFKRIQLMIYALSATVGYVGIKLIILFDPVVGIVSEKYFIASTLFIIIFSLLPSKTEQAMIVLFMTFVNGEWVLRLVLYEIGLSYYRTNEFSLDVLAISLSALLISTFLIHTLQHDKVKQSNVRVKKEKAEYTYEILREKAQ